MEEQSQNFTRSKTILLFFCLGHVWKWAADSSDADGESQLFNVLLKSVVFLRTVAVRLVPTAAGGLLGAVHRVLLPAWNLGTANLSPHQFVRTRLQLVLPKCLHG